MKMNRQTKSMLRFLLNALLGRNDRVFVHSVSNNTIESNFVLNVIPTEADIANCERLLKAYSKAKTQTASFDLSSGDKSDIWTEIESRQKSFLGTLSLNDPRALARYLCNMSMLDATQGTVQGDLEYEHLKLNPWYRKHVARMANDKLVLLAEALGAIACENPEQGAWGVNAQLDIKSLVVRVESILGINIAPPQFDGGLFKIGQSPYQFSERDLNALYTAYLLCSMFQKKLKKICEIGGGVGRVAFWATRLGVSNYTIIDLPHINVLQGFYLLKSLPRANITLYGESEVDNSLLQYIRIMPDHTIGALVSNKYDVVLNQDSFPEISESIVLDYLAWIQKNSNWFLSINHESMPRGFGAQIQNRVPDLVSRYPAYKRSLRFPYWLRKGYIAELYEINED